MSFADTIVALEDGRIAQAGSPQALLAYEGYVSKLELALRDEDAIKKHVEDPEISKIESTVAESFISAHRTIDETIDAPDATRKNGDWSVYSYYFSSSGYTIFIMFLISMAAWIFCTEFASECNEFLSNHTKLKLLKLQRFGSNGGQKPMKLNPTRT